MKKYLLLLAMLLVSCQSTGGSDLTFGATHSEQLSGYSYVPVEPSRVLVRRADTAKEITKKEILKALPDNSIRIATRQIGGSVENEIGPIGLNSGTAGNSYEVIIDYVTADTINVKFFGYWQPFKINSEGKIFDRGLGIKEFSKFPKNTPPKDGTHGTVWELVIYARESNEVENVGGTSIPRLIGITDRQIRNIFQQDIDNIARNKNNLTGDVVREFDPAEHRTLNEFNVPVYIGIGLRLKANVTVLKGTVHFTGIPAITSAVEAGKATGSLSVQTLGVTGPTPRTSLQLVSSIDIVQ